MLNISKVSISHKIDQSKYSVFQKLEERSISNALIYTLAISMLIAGLSMFLPWTQNVRSQGYVTTLNPYDRPQAIQSMIEGRIQKWYVNEGDQINMGDTILLISESKEEYLDPNLLARTQSQIDAKVSSSSAYLDKAGFLQDQYKSLLKNLDIKLEQNANKTQQLKVKLETNKIDLEAAKVKLSNSEKQRDRTIQLYDKGIKSLNDVEIKKLSFQEALAKVNELENKIINNRNEIANFNNNVTIIKNDFDQKLAKIESDRMSTLSMKFNADGDINKLKNKYNNYEMRSKAYAITSPINGTISATLKQGIGEFIKSGEDLATIVPINFDKAVEIFVRPQDMPLLKTGQRVRIQFDGWPAVVFSGWPDNSFGTFGGKIYAIDNDISPKKYGKNRILITQDKTEEKWPTDVRIGGGAQSLILLNEVPVYYEVWRQLNGFPHDYYQSDDAKKIKSKAPIRKIK